MDRFHGHHGTAAHRQYLAVKMSKKLPRLYGKSLPYHLKGTMQAVVSSDVSILFEIDAEDQNGDFVFQSVFISARNAQGQRQRYGLDKVFL